MNNISKVGTSSTTQFDASPILSFFKVLGLYSLSFAFWLWLFINNEGPGGIESQHLVLMGIVHTILVLIHAKEIFKFEEKND